MDGGGGGAKLMFPWLSPVDLPLRRVKGVPQEQLPQSETQFFMKTHHRRLPDLHCNQSSHPVAEQHTWPQTGGAFWGILE